MEKLTKYITKQNLLSSILESIISVGIVQTAKLIFFHQVGSLFDIIVSVIIITFVLIIFNAKMNNK